MHKGFLLLQIVCRILVANWNFGSIYIVVAFEILGKCQCTAGYKGRDCEVPCERGRYGIGCAYRCDCEHANSEGCDHVTGKCICNSGWRGKTYQYNL